MRQFFENLGDIIYGHLSVILISIGTIFAVVFSLWLYAVVQDEKEWQSYSVKHHCKEVGQHLENIYFTGANGTIFPSVVVHTIYACDGDEKVTR